MAKVLVVVRDFADYKKGERITDPDKVAELAVTHEHHVRAVMEPDAPEAPAAS